MGTTLACVQVYIGEPDRPEIVRQQLFEALRQQVSADGYKEIVEETNVQKREIYVGPFHHKPWLTIYDTGDDLRKVAQYLSKVTCGTAVFVYLQDSDFVHLRRYHAGEMVDDYCNRPDIYDLYTIEEGWSSDWPEGLNDEALALLTRGDVAKWKDLFVVGADLDEIRNVWDSRPVFADDILWPTAEAMNMDREALDAYFIDDVSAFLSAKFTKSSEVSFDDIALIYHTGASKIKAGNRKQGEYDYLANSEFKYTDSWMHIGEGSVGVTIEITGNAIEQGLVEIKEILVNQSGFWSESLGVRSVGAEQPFEVVNELNGNTGYRCVLNEWRLEQHVQLPEGINSVWRELSKEDQDKIGRLANQSWSHFRFVGRVQKSGSGEITVTVYPHENAEDGKDRFTFGVGAYPPRIPLRCDPTDVHPRTLLSLAKPTHLWGLMALNPDDEGLMTMVFDLIRSWVDQLPRKPKRKIQMFVQSDLMQRPQAEWIAIEDFAVGGKWDERKEHLKQCESLSLKWDKHTEFIFNRHSRLVPHATGISVPHILISYPVANYKKPYLQLVEDWLTEAADSLMTNGRLLQAMIDYSYPNTTTEFTAYETACQIGGQCTTILDWCVRFLRAVSEKMWLNSDLLSQLPDVEALENVCGLTGLGGGVRLVLRSDQSFEGLEKVLAPLLPSESDWEMHMRRLYSLSNE
ncbi:MAG: hypothetical protein KDE51_08920 [Anaerolineales bacterium]|nr:hypothetical protein [Anaerolineales bacterium]